MYIQWTPGGQYDLPNHQLNKTMGDQVYFAPKMVVGRAMNFMDEVWTFVHDDLSDGIFLDDKTEYTFGRRK